MRAHRIALLRESFPFLDKLTLQRQELNFVDADSIKVARGDNSLMARKGDWDSYSWSDGGHCDYTTFFAVLENGEIINLQEPGRNSAESGKWEKWDADTIGEQLFANNLHPDFIVEVVHNDTDDNGCGQETFFWTIYKMSKFDLLAHYEQMIDQAAREIKAELATVCREKGGK